MKEFKVSAWGEVPSIINNLVVKLNGKEATKEAIFNLDNDVTFIVCELKEAHGNLGDKNAWFSPKDGSNTFNVTINW